MLRMFGSVTSNTRQILKGHQIRKFSAYKPNKAPLPFSGASEGKLTLGFFLVVSSGTLAPYLIVFFQLSKNK